MFRKWILPLIALAGVLFAIKTVVTGQRQPTPAQPVAAPSRSPFKYEVAGAGIVEASTENIAIGTPVGNIVTEIFVKIGDKVKQGDPLFRLRDSVTLAELEVRKAALAAARAKLTRLKNLPRPEDLPPAEARVEEAKAQLEDAKNQLALWESQMITYGQSLCDYLASGATQDSKLQNVYYDAIRVFYQIADYTNNPAWNTCAQRARSVYRDRYVMTAACWPSGFGCVPGYWNFTHGERMDFERTADGNSKSAVLSQALNAAYSTDADYNASETQSAWLSREEAYGLMAHLNAERLGAAPRASTASRRSISASPSTSSSLAPAPGASLSTS